MKFFRNFYIITLISLVLTFFWSSPAFSIGTVTVNKSSDGLTIRIIGDDLDNEIIIVTDAAGNLVVTPDTAYPDPTIVTGSPVALAGVTQIIAVRMKDGSDEVLIGGFESAGEEVSTPNCDWVVKGNAGPDILGVGGFTARSLMVEGQKGNDFIWLGGVDTGVTVAEQSGADGGAGEERVMV